MAQRPITPAELYFRSAWKMIVLFVVFIGAVVLIRWDGNMSFLQGSIFEEDGEVLEELLDEGPVKISGNLKIDKFFPPRVLSLTSWKGETIEYPFFQRSRTFVPRFRLIRELKSGWKAVFVLTSSNKDFKPLTHEVNQRSESGLVKTRFDQLPGGRYALKVEVKNHEGKILKEITHNSIWILDKSIALLGDDIFSGIGQAVVGDEVFSETLFARPIKVVETDKTYGIEAYLEQAYRERGKVVFPLNLAWHGQTPGDFLFSWLEDGRKDYVFSLDGKKENESFLGVDEFWIGFFHTALARGLAPQDYLNELEAIVHELNKRGIGNDRIVIVEPPFSSTSDMREYVMALREQVPNWGINLGPPLYEETRNEYGKIVSLDREPHLTQFGMNHLSDLLLTFDLGPLELELTEE